MLTTRNAFTGPTFRAGSADDTNLAAVARSSRDEPGRFNTADLGVVYVARDPSTAMLELRRSIARQGCSLVDAHPCSLLVVDTALSSVVDLTVPGALAAWQLSPFDLTSDDMRRCREVAVMAARAGADGVRWKSAAGAGESMAIFAENLGNDSHVAVRHEFELTLAMLRAMERGASIGDVLPAIDRLGLTSTMPTAVVPMTIDRQIARPD